MPSAIFTDPMYDHMFIRFLRRDLRPGRPSINTRNQVVIWLALVLVEWSLLGTVSAQSRFQLNQSEGAGLELAWQQPLLSEKSGDAIIQELSTRRLLTIDQQDIELVRATGIPMPEGLTSVISLSQLLDLIQLLSELGKIK